LLSGTLVSAGAMPVGSATMKTGGDDVIQARWRGGGGWHRGGGWIPGAIIGGVLAGAAVAASDPYYYDGPGPYGYSYSYGYAYPYGPAYSGPYGYYAYPY
jgi:hypothetical protein